MRFFKKIQDWILKSERIRKWFCGTEGTEGTEELDSSVPLTHHDPRHLGLICFVKKRQNPFSVSLGFKNLILDFLKEKHPKFINRPY